METDVTFPTVEEVLEDIPSRHETVETRQGDRVVTRITYVDSGPVRVWREPWVRSELVEGYNDLGDDPDVAVPSRMLPSDFDSRKEHEDTEYRCWAVCWTHNQVRHVVYTLEISRPAVVSYREIRESVGIESDDYCNPPWEDCDGYEHELEETEFPEGEGYVYTEHKRIVLEPSVRSSRISQVAEDVRLDKHAAGASRQVAFELGADEARRTIRQLREWHNDGWHSYYVGLEFMGWQESLGTGVDDAAGSYAEEIANDLAGWCAAALEERGFTITDLPEPPVRDKLVVMRWRQKSFIVEGRKS